MNCPENLFLRKISAERFTYSINFDRMNSVFLALAKVIKYPKRDHVTA
jgi:hypothetical protein